MATILGSSWHKSSYRGGSEPNCVEVGPGRRVIGIRDTKDRSRGNIVVSRTGWAVFVGSLAR